MTPAVLGSRYRLQRRLGFGGMSVVHLAHDEVLDRPVAVKLLADRLGGDEELRARFLREGRFAARLAHPNVVAVFDTGEEDGQPYIVMEYVDGATLAEELHRRGALPAREVVDLGRQACAGLAHVHAAGLVHRDVKPHNLLLRTDGILKVADLGIARGGDRTLTQVGTLLGTAAYMAPEILRGERATAASDLYSLGAVLYELLTGQPPRKIASFADLDDVQPITEPGGLVPHPPPGLVATIMRCLDADPQRRPSSAAGLAAELNASEAPTEPISAASAVPEARAPRRLWLALAGTAAGIALAIVLVLFGFPGSTSDPPRPPRVAPVPVGASPAEDARNLSEWLRANSG